MGKVGNKNTSFDVPFHLHSSSVSPFLQGANFGNEVFTFLSVKGIVDGNVGAVLGMGPLQQKCKYCHVVCFTSAFSSFKRELQIMK